MQQFFSSISFCVRHVSYLFILCLPVMTIEFALTYLVTSIGIDANMSDSAALEVLSSISSQLFILVVLSLIFSVGLSGGVMAAFKALSSNNELTPYQALYAGIKKFFPLLLGNLIHSLAYGIGFLLLVLPGFFLYARLGLFPLFIMFEDQRALDALGESWQATDEFGTKLFLLTTVFLGIQIIFGLAGGLAGIDSSIGFLVLATLIKYATMMPLFYLFYSLYQSLERKH